MANVTNPASGVDVLDKTYAKLVRWGLVYTGPVSYATGGDPILASDVGLGNIDFVDAGNAYNGTNSTYMLAYIPSTGKIIWYVPNTNAEVAAAVNLSTYTAVISVVGH